MNFSDMTVTQLREIAADLNIPGRSKMKKAELIAAIEFAEAPSVDNISGGVDIFADDFDHSAAVAKLRADREAEEEERAAARRARNRSNYAPVIEAAQQPVADTGKIAITKYSGHEAIATAVFGTDSIAGHVTRNGGRWELRDGVRKIRAKTLGKVAKQWAKALAFHATTIDVETMG